MRQKIMEQMEYFQILAQKFHYRLKNNHYDPDAFTNAAVETLIEFPAYKHIDLDTLSDSIFSMDKLGMVEQSHPANGILTAFSCPVFDILIHIWDDDLGSPHQHDWPGAFQILHGRPLHAHYEYTETEKFGQLLQTGTLKLKRLERLGEGRTLPVYPGRRYIHGLSHVERPSISISIRAVNRNTGVFTMNYWRPGVAVATAYPDMDNATKALYRWLDMLHSCRPEEYVTRVGKLIEECNPVIVYFGLLHAHRVIIGEMEKLIAIGRKRFNDAAFFNTWTASLNDMARTDSFEVARESIHDEDLRFLLGVLYFAEDRKTVVTTVANAFGADGVQNKILDWVVALMKFSPDKSSGNIANDGAIAPEILKLLAEGPKFEQFIYKLKTVYEEDSLDAQMDSLRTLYTDYQGSAILAPLFVQG